MIHPLATTRPVTKGERMLGKRLLYGRMKRFSYGKMLLIS
jgi:hypothetical protein